MIGALLTCLALLELAAEFLLTGECRFLGMAGFAGGFGA